jgi:tetratricopeptide (TPR) repeat protein
LSGKQKEIINKISEQYKKNPTNKTYPYYLGIAYSNTGDNEKAVESYAKAIEIDSTYFDAYLNLGGILLNKGLAILKVANELPPTSKQKEYDDKVKLATVEFDRALPYLEKANSLDPKSRPALDNLKIYYLVKRNQPKADEIAAKIEAL